MIWDFGDGNEYESDFSVQDYEYESAEEVARLIIAEIDGFEVFERDPMVDYERLHRKVATSMNGTERAKAAFIASALDRISRWGKAVLIGNDSVRIVVRRELASVLRKRTTESDLSKSIANQIAQVTGGVVRKLIY